MYNSLTGDALNSAVTSYFFIAISSNAFKRATLCCCSLLLRRESCTFSNGEYVKAGLAELEIWCAAAKQEVFPLPVIIPSSMFMIILVLFHSCS